MGNETWAAVRVVAEEVHKQYGHPEVTKPTKPDQPIVYNRLGERNKKYKINEMNAGGGLANRGGGDSIATPVRRPEPASTTTERTTTSTTTGVVKFSLVK